MMVAEKILIGQWLAMSLSQNTTAALWQAFMPKRREIQNAVATDLYSVQVYPRGYFEAFDPTNRFEKWAAVEVASEGGVPDGMESFRLQEGQYAVFHYKGRSSDPGIYQYIFTTWLPNSPYALDERPHFEVLGERYKNDDPNSEEEIYIPIREKP